MSRERLIDGRGQPRWGRFAERVTTVNWQDFEWRSTMDRPRSRLAKRMKLNQFHFVGFTGPGLVGGLAIVDLKWVANCFAYVFEPRSGRFEECSSLVPLALGAGIEPSPVQGRAHFRGAGFNVSIEPRSGRREVRARLPKGLRFEFTLIEPKDYDYLSVCTRAGYDGWTFTQKAAALPLQGTVHAHGQLFDLQTLGCLGSTDWSAGFMRRETNWNWASLSTLDDRGRRIGFNAAAGMNETSFTENGVWVDGRLRPLAGVHFDFDRRKPLEPWQLRDQTGDVELSFQPDGLRRERINAWLLASNFRQVFGRFSGRLRGPDGEWVAISERHGFVEDHYARW